MTDNKEWTQDVRESEAARGAGYFWARKRKNPSRKTIVSIWCPIKYAGPLMVSRMHIDGRFDAYETIDIAPSWIVTSWTTN